MNVLGIETSGVIGSVAACRDDEVVVEQQLETGMDHGRMLVSLVDRVVGAAGWDKRRSIDLVVVSQGPGSFTGLRVGVAFAKTFATLLNKPIVGVGSLDAMAVNAPGGQGRILCILDAKRGEVYAAAFERDTAGRLRRRLEPVVRTPVAVRMAFSGPAYVMGDGLLRHAAEFPASEFTHAPVVEWRIRASTVARLGLEAFRAGRRDDPVTLEPVYLRLAEAEEKRLARERGSL